MRKLMISFTSAVGAFAALPSGVDAAVVLTGRSSDLANVAFDMSTVPPPDTYMSDGSTASGQFTDENTQGTLFSVSSTPGYYSKASQDTTADVTGGILSVSGNGQLNGQLRGTSNSSLAVANASTSLTVTFNVTDTSADYVLKGLTYAGPNGINAYPSGTIYASVELLQGSTPIESFSGAGNWPLSTPFDTSGVLAPGSYSLVLTAQYNVTLGNPPGPVSPISASFSNIDFTVTPAPEPGTLSLLALAGLALLGRRRRAA